MRVASGHSNAGLEGRQVSHLLANLSNHRTFAPGTMHPVSIDERSNHRHPIPGIAKKPMIHHLKNQLLDAKKSWKIGTPFFQRFLKMVYNNYVCPIFLRT